MKQEDITSHAERELRGVPLYVQGGESIGTVETVLRDKATGKAEWLAIRLGFLEGKQPLVPVQMTERRADGCFVPFSADRVKSAPGLVGNEVSQAVERRLASHYGLDYSERRSPSGLAQGRSGQRGRGGGRQRTRAPGSSSRRRAASAQKRRSTGPTRAELYEQAKRLGIEGRSKMNKTQLARAVGRRRSASGSKRRGRRTNPVEVQAFLEGVGYPTRRGDLVRAAARKGATERVRTTLERLPDREFDSPAEVSEAIGRLG